MKNESSDLNQYLLSAMPIIKRIAKSKARWGLSYLDHDDLIQEGCLGLMQAFKRYETSVTPFMAFALPRIKGSIIDALRKSMFASRDQGQIIPPMIEISEYYDSIIKAGKHGRKLMDNKTEHIDKDVFENDHVEAAMRLLRPTQRRLLENIYYKGMDRKDIAKELNIHADKLFWKEQNALKELKVIMQNMDKQCN